MSDVETPDIQPDLEAIYERMRKRVFRMFGYRDDVDDILQASMEAFVKARSSFRGEGSIEGFAEAIAMNVARTWMRRHYRANAIKALVTEQEPWQELPPGPSEEVERRNRLRRLLEILQRMKPRYRMAIQLYYIEGKPVDEIARIEGITTNAAYVRINRGRKDLRRRAGKDPVLAEMLREMGGDE